MAAQSLQKKLVMVEWKGKDAVKDGGVAFSCLLNCLRVSLLGFSSYINVSVFG